MPFRSAGSSSVLDRCWLVVEGAETVFKLSRLMTGEANGESACRAWSTSKGLGLLLPGSAVAMWYLTQTVPCVELAPSLGRSRSRRRRRNGNLLHRQFIDGFLEISVLPFDFVELLFKLLVFLVQIVEMALVVVGGAVGRGHLSLGGGARPDPVFGGKTFILFFFFGFFCSGNLLSLFLSEDSLGPKKEEETRGTCYGPSRPLLASHALSVTAVSAAISWVGLQILLRPHPPCHRRASGRLGLQATRVFLARSATDLMD